MVRLHSMTFADKSTLGQAAVLGIMLVQRFFIHTRLNISRQPWSPSEPKSVQLAQYYILPELPSIRGTSSNSFRVSPHLNPFPVSAKSRTSAVSRWQMDEVCNSYSSMLILAHLLGIVKHQHIRVVGRTFGTCRL